MQTLPVMVRQRRPSGVLSAGDLGPVTPEWVVEHLARAGYRFIQDGGPGPPVFLVEPGDPRSRRLVKRVHLWQQGAGSIAYAIDFAPVRALQVLGAAFCAAGVAIAPLRPVFWFAWLIAIGFVLLALPELILATARTSTRETLEWAARFPRLPPSRCKRSTAAFPEIAPGP